VMQLQVRMEVWKATRFSPLMVLASLLRKNSPSERVTIPVTILPWKNIKKCNGSD
jgi:hypothetical protein